MLCSCTSVISNVFGGDLFNCGMLLEDVQVYCSHGDYCYFSIPA